MEKNERIHIRVSMLDKRIIENKARQAGLSVSEFLCRCALGRKVSYKLTTEELGFYRMLTKYHNNFQRISNLVKAKDTGLLENINHVVSLLKVELKKFN